MGVFRQFPYSNFHEMNMDEMIKIIKNMLEEWAQYHAEWDAWMAEINDDWSNYQEVMNEAWADMQDFINNYFDNLDVQEEINNKITSMVQTGAFIEIVEPYIPTEVSTWLIAHITEPTGVVIDTSLSVAGACADAKVTGDTITTVKNYLNGIKTDNLLNTIDTTKWKQGDYDSTVSYKVTQYIPASDLIGETIYICGEGWDSNSQYIMTARFLDVTNTQISAEAVSLDPNIWYSKYYTVPASTDKIAIVINTNNASIPISPASICAENPHLYVGLTNVQSASDFYYMYEGLIPEPYSPNKVWKSFNMFDNTDITMDKYWNGSGIGDAEGYYIADIKVKGGVRIVSNAINKDFSYYVSDNYYDTPAQRKKLTTYGYATIAGSYAYADFVPPVDGHLLLTGNTNTKSDPSLVMVLEGSYVPDEYIAYGEMGAVYVGETCIYPQTKEVIVVANDGSGDYEKLKEALDYASTSHNITVYVKAGTYDLISEFGSAYFEAFDADSDEASGLQIGNNNTYIFGANTLVTANYTGGNQYVESKFSPFNLIKNSEGFTLEGLNLECSNCRYGIHDEDITRPTPYRNTFKNCSIKIDNSSSSWGGKQCIGGGLGKNGSILIENCVFESVGVADNYAIVSYHNGNGSISNPVKNKLTIKDNYFEAGTIRVSYYGSHTEMSTAIVSNNSVTSAPVCTPETAGSVTVNMELKAWNNEIRS